MINRDLAAFNEFLFENIPLVRFMQLQLISCSENKLTARAPAKPNLNDKQTIFGGSSAALMTVCGWSLIKFNIEQRQYNNDVVIADAHTRWRRAQNDELLITAESQINWPTIIGQMSQNQHAKIKVHCQVGSSKQKRCSEMNAEYVILNS